MGIIKLSEINILLRNKLPIDILELIQNILKKSCLINQRWDFLYQRMFLKLNKYHLIDYYQSLHLYTRKIADLGRLYFKHQCFLEGEKMIRVSKFNHLFVEEYIKCVCHL